MFQSGRSTLHMTQLQVGSTLHHYNVGVGQQSQSYTKLSGYLEPTNKYGLSEAASFHIYMCTLWIKII